MLELPADKFKHQLKLKSENLNHPIMVYLHDRIVSLVLEQKKHENIKMPALFDHLNFLKKEYEIDHDAKYKDLAMVYHFAECCGYSIIIKKGDEELLIKYNPKAPLSE